ncbi:MAG TPA: hypothetical protein PLP66_01670 [Phycisphaerae bacterium]|jgi:DNA-directed RNA polymerase subunit RPC12/RpoP|nr:hypothetical protein [Phycisphaerae bacterium]HPM22582.1 hypothetical protein [Phycisphaerae bacterium]HQL54609.1 hypothetical protein [Phycisphaerae bacterium]
MTTRVEPPDDSDHDWDELDPEGPQARDLSRDDDETATVPCPHCRRPVPDFVDRCPYCGDWIVQSAGEPRRRHIWLVLCVLLAGALLLLWGIR